MKKVYLTVDLEEWWSVHSFNHLFKSGNHEIPEDRIDKGLLILLDLLNAYNVKATFFILGRVAENHPDIIKEIAGKGHDIGTHGYSHELIYNMTPAEFENDLVRSKELLERNSGLPVTKYRAPSYSITSKSLWALELLVKNGITTDSSIMPSVNKRFGIPNMPTEPYKITFGKGLSDLLEVPPTILSVAGKKIPISSGIAFRIFPLFLIRHAFKKYHRKNIDPMVIIHNWELDLEQPVLNAGLKGKIIHYQGLHKTASNLKNILSEYQISNFHNFDRNSVNKSLTFQSIISDAYEFSNT
jgi:polysaccharide deacetylase family protein (PEP-CTERM system associated)